MPLSIDIPEYYGLVVLGNIVAPAITLIILGGKCGAVRKRTGVPLPFMQAMVDMDDGKGNKVSKAKALEFNCIQRGHHK